MQEGVKDGGRGDPQSDCSPRQRPGFQPHFAVPLLAVPLLAEAQPAGRDLAEAGRVAARLVHALRERTSLTLSGAGRVPVRRRTASANCCCQSRGTRPVSEAGAAGPRSLITSPSRRIRARMWVTSTLAPWAIMRNSHHASSRRIASGSGDRSMPADRPR